MQCNFFFPSVETKQGFTAMCSINVVEINGTKHWYEPTKDEINKYCGNDRFRDCPRVDLSTTCTIRNSPYPAYGSFNISK